MVLSARVFLVRRKLVTLAADMNLAMWSGVLLVTSFRRFVFQIVVLNQLGLTTGKLMPSALGWRCNYEFRLPGPLRRLETWVAVNGCLLLLLEWRLLLSMSRRRNQPYNLIFAYFSGTQVKIVDRLFSILHSFRGNIRHYIIEKAFNDLFVVLS